MRCFDFESCVAPNPNCWQKTSQSDLDPDVSMDATEAVETAPVGDRPPHPVQDQGDQDQRDQEEGGGGSEGSLLLDYERHMVEGLVEEDGLCIMSAGMGWQKVGGDWATWCAWN